MSDAVVGAFAAKTHFSELLARAAGGETIVVSKHGVPVAQLAPLRRPAGREDAVAAMAEMLEARRHLRLDGLKLSELIAEGRR
ncbi:MAG: type II toxin-antitoxin system prevent-host-death family antitoxin [Bifidobacteriaceae bacterium]|jgi:prevent-host-death family protein|nr:type II toxin-antitoxin system prevent-host-death family antitoxin [Bifidobacteriaceae bacterium]